MCLSTKGPSGLAGLHNHLFAEKFCFPSSSSHVVVAVYLLTTEVPCILETNQEACATSSLEDPQTLISEFLSPLLNPPAMRDKASLAGWNLPDTVSL